jgi:hypothetical protein
MFPRGKLLDMHLPDCDAPLDRRVFARIGMRFVRDPSLNTSDLRVGFYAEPGIYVVTHHNPAHAVPHEVIIEEPTLLPPCRFCDDVRFSLKSTPERIAENYMFSSVPHKLSVRILDMAAELRACTDASVLKVLESRHLLDSYNYTRK